MLATLAISIIMSVTPPSVHDTRDLDFRVPSFRNAPKFDLQRSVRGENPVRNPRESRPRLRDRDDDLVRLLKSEFGDRYTIIRWRGAIIVKPLKEVNKKRRRGNNKRRR